MAVNPLESLATLLKLRSATNVSGIPTNRGLDVATGMDEFEPTEQELMDAQSTPTTSGPYQVFKSRDSIRDNAMQTLRRTMGLQAQEHEREMEGKLKPIQERGRYDVQVAQEETKAAEAARRSNQDAILERQREARDFQAQQNELNRANAAALQEDRQAAAAAGGSQNPIPATMYGAAEKARGTFNSPMSRLGRMVGLGGGADAYESSLTNILDRKGTLAEVQEVLGVLQGVQGGSIDERIANSGVAGLQQLDPYERQYLALKLGL